MEDRTARRERLLVLAEQARGCTRCPSLVQARTQVVFGAGDPDAALMLVGEAPGANEDELGVPLVGRAGQLLDQLLGELGLARRDVFLTTLVRCRPPGNRDPAPAEIARCEEYLLAQLELVQPALVCPLGQFATKLLRGDPAPITRVRGRAEVRVLGTRAVRLYPLLHPAAALYTPAGVEQLRADFARVPALLALGPPDQPGPPPPPEPEPRPPALAAGQLGLF